MDRRTIIAGLTIVSMLIPIASHAAAPQLIPKQPIVIIDPGHGGADWGATDGNKEKDAVMAIGSQVAKILEIHGVKAILTRNGDYFINPELGCLAVNPCFGYEPVYDRRGCR